LERRRHHQNQGRSLCPGSLWIDYVAGLLGAMADALRPSRDRPVSTVAGRFAGLGLYSSTVFHDRFSRSAVRFSRYLRQLK